MLHVRRSEASAAEVVKAEDLGTGKLRAESEVSLAPGGPFAKLAAAVHESGTMRDALARVLDAPSTRNLPRIRMAVLAVSAAPLLMLLELDRELVFAKAMSPARLVMDFVLAAYVVYELTRRTPRLPGVAAVVMASAALRFVSLAVKPCGHGVHVLVYAGAVLAAAGALAIVGRLPTRRRVALELLDRMHITRSEAYAATEPAEPESGLLGFAIVAAAGLPALLYALRRADASLVTQTVLAAAYGLAIPFVARKVAKEPVLRAPSGPPPRAVLFGAFAGLALTFALLAAARDFFHAGADLARCVGRLDAETKRALAAEATEIARSISRVKSSTLLVFSTTMVFPFVEERIYRALVQDVLVRKYGVSYGVFASAVVFGVAHFGIYEVALYQTVMLGIGFGVAWLEGGLLAAFVVHACWNVAMLV